MTPNRRRQPELVSARCNCPTLAGAAVRESGERAPSLALFPWDEIVMSELQGIGS
jgi:hypothetical protein